MPPAIEIATKREKLSRLIINRRGTLRLSGMHRLPLFLKRMPRPLGTVIGPAWLVRFEGWFVNGPRSTFLFVSGAGGWYPLAEWGASRVLALAPKLDDDLTFAQRVEDLSVEHFIAEASIESLDVTFLPS